MTEKEREENEEQEAVEVMDELCNDERKISVGSAFTSLMESLSILDKQSEIFARLRMRVSEKFYDEFLASLIVNLAGAILSTDLPDEKKREIWNGELIAKLAKVVSGAPSEITEVTKDDGKQVGKA